MSGEAFPEMLRRNRVKPADLNLEIVRQPDDETCGPTCLHSLYEYWGDPVPLEQVISEVERLHDGGTLAVLLACHALQRNYAATIYTYNLQVFDPTWFSSKSDQIVARLRRQIEVKDDPKIRAASQAYIEFLERGGELRFEDLTPELIREPLRRGVPIVTGLSATYLYRTPREYGEEKVEFDDVRGVPSGHFVILCGYDEASHTVRVADPLEKNPTASHKYDVDVDRLVCAILLGILTHDANLLILEPRK